MVELHQQEEAKRCARHAKEVARSTRGRSGGGGSITTAVVLQTAVVIGRDGESGGKV